MLRVVVSRAQPLLQECNLRPAGALGLRPRAAAYHLAMMATDPVSTPLPTAG